MINIMSKFKKCKALIWYDKKGVKHTKFRKDKDGNYPLWDEVEHNFTVWVGGTEISDHYMTKEDAESTAEMFVQNGYTDVIVEEVEKL